MKTRGLYGKKYLDIELRERELGAPGDDQVIVKIMATGVCGTDINFVRDWSDEHMALGHEIAAEVVEVGRHVTHVKPGDRVIVEDCTMCGVCDDCKSGHPEWCRNMYGLDEQAGLGDYMCLRYNSLVKFPSDMDFLAACITEPLAVSLTSVLNAQIPLGGSVLVLGPGPLGIMAAAVAKIRGAGWVGITGLPADNPREKQRLETAKAVGCDTVIETGKQDVEDEIKTRFPAGVDRVIVSSPPHSMYDALKVIRYGGIITFFGLHFGDKSKITVDVNDLIFRKITLVPTFAEPAINFPVSNRLLYEGLVDYKQIINRTFHLDEAKSVMQAVIDGSEPIIKAAMVPDGKAA